MSSPLPDKTLRELFDVQQRASRAQTEVPLALRRDRLLRLRALLDVHRNALARAVELDFGVRSVRLTEIADMFVLQTLLASTLKSLRKWMKPVRVPTPLYLQPSRAFLLRQPLGVVGVISPWNYPIQLALGPVITALAAGNRVMLKPSDVTPQTSALLASLIGDAFSPDELCVVQGDGHVAAQFSSLPFDHLFFTGSTAVGRQVAQAAAANLTPTTLELGGKSPCVIDATCSADAFEEAVLKIAHGKLLNAGQTCIAPDYVLLKKGQEGAFTAAFERAVARLFPDITHNPDYAAIINTRHRERLQALLAEAEGEGARLHIVNLAPSLDTTPATPVSGTGNPIETIDGTISIIETGLIDARSRQMAPVLVFGAPATSTLLTEEIFGPILPVVTYETPEEAISYINARPRPLAMYWFGKNKIARDELLARTVSGGVTVNDTLMHVAHENLPFGGVGESGWGSYHGEAGFLRLTHQKPVLIQSAWVQGQLFYPPYGKRFDRVLGWLRHLV